MPGGNMAGLMADNKGQFRLVVDDAHQLAGKIDIAARHGEGILHRAVERSKMVDLTRVGRTGIGRDPAAYALYIAGPRAGQGPAKLRDYFGVLSGCFLDVARVKIGQRLLQL